MCECIKAVNAALVEHNARLQTLIIFGGEPLRPAIPTEKIENRRDGKRPPMLKAKYCPFCGEEYAGAQSKRVGEPAKMPPSD